MATRDPESITERVSEIERWREKEAEPALAELKTHLAELADEKRIARRVAEELRRRGIAPSAEETATAIEHRGGVPRLPLTWYQKAGAFFAGAVILADALKGLFS